MSLVAFKTHTLLFFKDHVEFSMTINFPYLKKKIQYFLSDRETALFWNHTHTYTQIYSHCVTYSTPHSYLSHQTNIFNGTQMVKNQWSWKRFHINTGQHAHNINKWTHTHTYPPRPHSFSLSVVEQREVVADVKHQFPG